MSPLRIDYRGKAESTLGRVQESKILDPKAWSMLAYGYQNDISRLKDCLFRLQNLAVQWRLQRGRKESKETEKWLQQLQRTKSV